VEENVKERVWHSPLRARVVLVEDAGIQPEFVGWQKLFSSDDCDHGSEDGQTVGVKEWKD
jgi:hypothetical protein